MTSQSVTRRAETQPQEREVYRTPRVNIIETDNTYIVEAEMPGVPKDGFEVHVDNKVLSLTGKRTVPEGTPVAGTPVAGYHRGFNLGDAIDAQHIDAAAKNGILTVTLHKVAERVPRQIEVKID